MKVSLILATVNRRKEVEKFLLSLKKQIYKNFELILCDQNNPGFLDDLIVYYKKAFPIIHLYTQKGLSNSRNEGIKNISGEIVAFPDDDCFYPPFLLQEVVNFFKSNPTYQVLTCVSRDEGGKISQGRFRRKAGRVTKWNVFFSGISYTIFLKKEVIEKVGPFDINLGVGSGTPFNSGEETDYILRALERGFKIYYNPHLFVFHEDKVKEYNDFVVRRAFNYGMGAGAVLKKHKFPLFYFLYFLVRPLVGAFFSLILFKFKKANFHFNQFLGRLQGWLRYEDLR
ncbi:MAG: glycosyltransferase family 2 protein [Caldimicrobium sp.]